MRRLITPHRAVDITPDTLALWRCDEYLTSGLSDSLGAYTLTDEGGTVAVAPSLFEVPAGSTGARRFNNSGAFVGATDAAFRSALLGEWTITGIFRLPSLGGVRTILSVISDSSGTSADNSLLGLYVDGSELRFRWERLTGTEETRVTTGLGLEAARTYMFFARKRLASNKFDYDVTLGVWDLESGDGRSETFTFVVNAAGGGNTAIRVGGDSYGNLNGDLDDLRIEKVALTDEAIRRIALDYAADYDEAALLASRTYKTALRVRVEDGDGNLRDLSALNRDLDFVLGARWGEDIDSPGLTAEIELAREHYAWSIARDMEESPLNLRASDGLFDPLITVHRRVMIETAIVPSGFEPREIDFVLRFDGLVDDVDWSRSSVVVSARDRIAELQDTFIESTGVEIANIEAESTNGPMVVDTVEPHGLESGQRVSHYGTESYDGSFTVRAVVSPTRYLTREHVTGLPDGEQQGAVFGPDIRPYGSPLGKDADLVMQDLIDDNEPAGGWKFDHTVYTPVPIDHAIRTYNQILEPLRDALDVIATATGRVIRYKWDDNRYDFRLTYYTPDREKSDPDWTVSPDDYLDVESVGISKVDIRNAVEIRFVDHDGEKDADGNYPRRVIKKENAASIAKYGRRASIIGEASTSSINRLIEAEALADAFLADLSEPKAHVETLHPYMPYVELGDLGRFEANGTHWSESKDLAVTAYDHACTSSGEVTTRLRLRGQPAGARLKLFTMIVYPSLSPNTQTRGPEKPSGLTMSCRTYDTTVSWTHPANSPSSRHFLKTEVYLSDDADAADDFVPSADNLWAITSANSIVITDLSPGKTHWVKIRHIGKNGEPGPFSEPVSCMTLAEVVPVVIEGSHRFSASDHSSGTIASGSPLSFLTVDYDPVGMLSSSVATVQRRGLWSIESALAIRGGNCALQIEVDRGYGFVASGGRSGFVTHVSSGGEGPSIARTLNAEPGDRIRVTAWDTNSTVLPLGGDPGDDANTFFRGRLVFDDPYELPPGRPALEYREDEQGFSPNQLITALTDHGRLGGNASQPNTGLAPIYRAGAIGNLSAMEFDGVDDVLQCGTPALDVGRNVRGLTFAAVLRSDSVAAGNVSAIEVRGGGGLVRANLGRGGNQWRLGARITDTGGVGLVAVNGGVVDTDRFSIVIGVVSFEDDETRLYQDGVLVASGTTGGAGRSPNTASTEVTIGPGWDGMISRPLIYSRALSASEVQSLTEWYAERF